MNKIEELYDQYDEENRLLRSRECRVESETTIKYLSPYMKNNKSVLEIGCGTGYYGFYFAGKIKDYTGIDLSARNIRVFQRAINDLKVKNLSCEVGDALSLNQADNTFDVVLNLGPLYHFGEKEAERCIDEAVRVCKKGGILAFSYMNKFGNFVKLCAQEAFVGMYPTETLLENMLNKNMDDEELFFFTTPEKIEESLSRRGLEVLHNLTTDGTTMHHHRIADFRDDEFALWLKFHLATCEEPSIRGLGDHGLIICKKK